MPAPSFIRGFVDICMYLVARAGSKNAACMRPDKLRRIFRTLRLADLQQSCRLPLGVGGSRQPAISRFALQNVLPGKRNADGPGSRLPLPSMHPQADSGRFFEHAPGAVDLFGQI